jgi:DNA-binding CsgD family transcriptional regulator
MSTSVYRKLTLRQIALLKAMRDGNLIKETSATNRKTKSKDTAKIRTVLNAKTNTHAVAIALALGWISPVRIPGKESK